MIIGSSWFFIVGVFHISYMYVEEKRLFRKIQIFMSENRLKRQVLNLPLKMSENVYSVFKKLKKFFEPLWL